MKYIRCHKCTGRMKPTFRGYECGYCGNTIDDPAAGQNYRKRHFRRYYMPAASGVSILLGAILPWYQKKENCRVLLWEIDIVTDSMGLLKGMHASLQGWYYIWLVLFMVSLIAASMVFVKSDFRKMPAVMLIFLILLMISLKAAPPDLYMKALPGRFFMTAGFMGCLISWFMSAYFSGHRQL